MYSIYSLICMLSNEIKFKDRMEDFLYFWMNTKNNLPDHSEIMKYYSRHFYNLLHQDFAENYFKLFSFETEMKTGGQCSLFVLWINLCELKLKFQVNNLYLVYVILNGLMTINVSLFSAKIFPIIKWPFCTI